MIRIRCDDVTAQCVLGMKFGCCPDEEAPPLMRRAKDLGLQVIQSLAIIFILIKLFSKYNSSHC